MTFFHFHAQVHQRSKGQSAVAAAAYRAGACLDDLRTGICHDYEARLTAGSVAAREILHPAGAPWAADRSDLWNAAEVAEVRRNACVAREYEAAIPADLPRHRMIAMAREFAQLLVERFRVVVDWALHRPRRGSRDWHTHVLTTTRVADEAGLAGKTRQLDDRRTGSAEIKQLRAAWAAMCNRELDAIASPLRVDHRSYSEQGVDRIAQKHLAKAAAALERRGTPTRIGDYNRQVRMVNQLKLEAMVARDEAARDQVIHEQAAQQVKPASVRPPQRLPPKANAPHTAYIDDALSRFVTAAQRRGKEQGGLTDAALARMVAEMAAGLALEAPHDRPPASATPITAAVRRDGRGPTVGTIAFAKQSKDRPLAKPDLPALAMWLELDGIASLLRRRRRARAVRKREKQQAQEAAELVAAQVAPEQAEPTSLDAVSWMTDHLAGLAEQTAPAFRRFRKSIAENAAAALRASASGSARAGRAALKAMLDLLAPEPVDHAVDQVPPDQRTYIDEKTGRRYRLSKPLTNEEVAELRRQYPGTPAKQSGESETGPTRPTDGVRSRTAERSAGGDSAKPTATMGQKQKRSARSSSSSPER